MTRFAEDSWRRALASLETARLAAPTDPDSAASRAYYAGFHAITALFALRDQYFTKHAQLRAAMHRDLVHTGEWRADLGGAFNELTNLRQKGDYGDQSHVSAEEIGTAIEYAVMILEAVRVSAAGRLV